MGKGELNLLDWNFAYLIIFLLFFVSLFFFVNSNKDNAAYWEDYYAKEIALVIDRANPGENYEIDVTKAINIASRNKNADRIFDFDNVKKEVIVNLGEGYGTRYRFLNDVTVSDWNVELVSGGIESSRLVFGIK